MGFAPIRLRVRAPAWAALLLALVGCGEGGNPPATVRDVTVSATSTSLLVGASTQLSALVLGTDGNPVSGASVTWSSITPTTVSVSSTGVATAIAPGTGTVRATAGGRSGDVSLTIVNPPAASVSFDKDSATLTLPNATATLAPVARDASGRALVNPTFFFASDNPKVVTVSQLGVVTAVAAGTAAVTATTEGKTASIGIRVTANVTATSPRVTTVTNLRAGGTGTITGSNFAASASGNTVLVEGVTATVTAATSTQLNITLPASGWACDVGRTVAVQVNANNEVGVGKAVLRTSTSRTLAVGQSMVLSASADARCNDIVGQGGTYLVNVYNVARTLSGGDATFTLGGVSVPFTGTAAAVAPSRASLTAPSRGAPSLRRSTVVESSSSRDARHADILQRSVDFARAAGSPLAAWRRQRAGVSDDLTLRTARASQLGTVGSITQLKIPNLDAASFCGTSIAIGARTAYVGQHAIIVEDTASSIGGVATLKGQLDSLYTQLGQEFDNVMWPALTQNFGNPLAMDSRLSSTGKIVMVFSPRVNAMAGGSVSGFVVSCDFFPTSQAASSNVGEYFYAVSPTSLATGYGVGTRASWLREQRGTVMHEVKHITSFGERFARNADFEELWLEEGTARHAEELLARSIYGVSWKGNVGYQASVYCDQRPASASAPQCAGKPILMLRHFDALYQYLQAPDIYTMFGRTGAGDATYYATSWSMVRWMIDHYATNEAAFLSALTQSTKSGVANLEARITGTTWEEMFGEWALTLYADDLAGLTTTNARLRFPSWNLRDQFQGLCNDKGPCVDPNNVSNLYPLAFPFVPRRIAVSGSFATTVGPLQAATFSSWLITVPNNTTELLDLRSATGGDPAAQLRIAILRVQ